MSIEAMKQALEALECLFGIPEQFTGKGGGDVAVWTLGGSYRAQQAIPVLRQAIERAEKQEPVALKNGECWPEYVMEEWDYWRKQIADGDKSSAPRDWFEELAELKLVTAQPQREWVGLTEEDKQIAFDDTQEASGGFWEFADAIEAKLKEKNT